MPPGVRRLGRKRFAEAVKYLKSVIADESKTDKMRMQAVESLLAIYDRNDRTIAQYETRRRAAEAAKDAEQPAQPEDVTQAPMSREDALRDARAFLARIGEQKDASER